MLSARYLKSFQRAQASLLRYASTMAEQARERGHLNKVLIANRGEIACRVIQSAKKMGVQSVAVFSDPDRNAMHVQMADEAFNVGPAASTQSYLRGEYIVDLALKQGAEAIHPGYGFLSENADFAELCEKKGVIFIGPPASAIRDMGSKSESKNIMTASNVPCVEGYHGDDQSDATLHAEADKIGYPLMIKAVKGGGGKGMRIVRNAKDFQENLDSARREAVKSFGDERVLIEKYIDRPRHIEVQVFADMHGNAVYLYERDCSVQRRHQKIIEEAPAPHLSEELRHSLGQAAVRAAKAVNYVGAGTVEFIFDTDTDKFYFMEMNTRLQVEHPVTEMITKSDLVEWQLRIAAGQPLPVKQEDIPLSGHSFEARIYAENPESNFLPGSGPLKFMRTPKAAADVRIETGVREGDEVSVHYDPMIAKLVVWGADRPRALAKLVSCLKQYNIAGLHTNIDFLTTLASHPEFKAGHVSTKFIEEHGGSLLGLKSELKPEIIAQAVLVAMNYERVVPNSEDVSSPWNNVEADVLDRSSRSISFTVNDTELVCKVQATGKNKYTITPTGQESFEVEGRVDSDGVVHVYLDGQIFKSPSAVTNKDVNLFTEGGHYALTLTTPSYLTDAGVAVGGNAIVAPMNGKIEKVHVNIGDEVEADQALVVMEAMKMELVLRSPRKGKIASINFKQGDMVNENAIIVKFEDEEE